MITLIAFGKLIKSLTGVFPILISTCKKIIFAIKNLLSRLSSVIRKFLRKVLNDVDYLQLLVFFESCFLVIYTIMFLVGFMYGYILFSPRGEKKLIEKLLHNNQRSILQKEKESIIDIYLKESLDEDYEISSNDIFHLRRSIGMSNN